MAKKRFFAGVLAMVLVLAMTVVGCEPDDTSTYTPDNTITSVSISLGYGNDVPRVGGELTATVRNGSGSSVSTGVSYQWKRADSQDGTFTNISGATSSRYTPVHEDMNKYIKVEAKNSDTPSPVESAAAGPVDGVVKPTVNPEGGNVISGQEITLTSATASTIIYYTLDGTTPTNSSTRYSEFSKPKITSSCTLKAIAIRSDVNNDNSEVLSVSYTVVAAPSFSAVTSITSTFSSGGIYSVAYGNNRFVAGGDNKIAYSTNGTTWTTSTGNSNFIVYGITYGTQFVAVGTSAGGVINYSSEGTSWSAVTDTTFGTSGINDVAYGGGKYVAVGQDGKIAYSTNGTSWTAVSDSTFGTSTINGITYAAGKFIAVGASNKMASSTDGITWTAVADFSFGQYVSTSAISGVAYGGPVGNEKFIVVGGGRYIAYSTDGVTWTGASVPSIDGLRRGVTWGGNKFIAVASAGVMLVSLDGINWARIDGGTGAGKTQFDNTGSYSSIRDIVYGGGKFLAVGSKSNDLGSGTGEMAISN